MKISIAILAFILLSACALEEAVDEEQQQVSVASTYVGCFIDTPAYDYYSPSYCYHGGSTPSTAVFRLFTSATPTHVEWSITDQYGNPKPATCSGVDCFVPIRPRQVVYGNVLYYVVNGTPTQGAYAIAEYEYEPAGR